MTDDQTAPRPVPPGNGSTGTDLGALKTMWRRVYQRAAQAGEERSRALLDEHRFRQHGRQAIVFVADGGGAALTPGDGCDVELPWAYAIEGWALYADQTGSAVVDVLAATGFAAYPTAASVCGGARPTLSGARKATSEDVSAWTRQQPRGTVLRASLVSAAAVTRLSLTLYVRAI